VPRDPAAIAARTLRVALVTAVVAALAGMLVDSFFPVTVGAWRGRTLGLGEVLRGVGVGAVVASPFAVLVVLAALGRRARLTWYASLTFLAALVGVFLAH
jgi:hypothetical protein